MDNLTQRMHHLPPELFNLIYDFTFHSAPNLQTIDSKYKPPSELQVDSISRVDFAKPYYSSTFYIEPENHGTVLTKWLASLPQAHIDLLAKVIVHKLHAYGTSCDCFVPEQQQPTLAKFRLKDWEAFLKAAKAQIPIENVQVSMFGKLWSFAANRDLNVVVDGTYERACVARSHPV